MLKLREQQHSLTLFCAAALLDFQDEQSAVQRSHSLSRLRRSSFQVKRSMQRVQDQRQMTALVKNSFTEALVVVLKCTDAINPFEEIWGALLCSASIHLPA